MKKGEKATGVLGDGIYPDSADIERQDGRVRIKHVIPYQTVEYVISKKTGNYAKGRVLNLVKKSPLETVPSEYICPHSQNCGGCLYQTVAYESQIDIKDRQLRKLIENYAGSDFIWEGIEKSPLSKGYRNKMEFSFGDEYKGGSLALGMHKRASHYDIVNCDYCNIVHSDFNKILSFTRDFFKSENTPYFHKNTRNGFLRHLILRRSETYKSLLIALVTTDSFGYIQDPNVSKAMPEACEEVKLLVERWREGIRSLEKKGVFSGKIAGIIHVLNNSYADAVIDQGSHLLYGDDYITERLMGLEFKISLFSFFQTNSGAAQILYSVAGRYMGDTSGKSVFDLYSGTGTIAQLLASYAQKVYGVEIVGEAVAAARENAARNKITNCEFIEGDVLKVIDSLLIKPDIIVLDPPRDGIHTKALPKITGYGAQKIIYIACKPSSFVRDLPVFEEAGYRLERAAGVDMFPYTPGVELVASLIMKE